MSSRNIMASTIERKCCSYGVAAVGMRPKLLRLFTYEGMPDVAVLPTGYPREAAGIGRELQRSSVRQGLGFWNLKKAALLERVSVPDTHRSIGEYGRDQRAVWGPGAGIDYVRVPLKYGYLLGSVGVDVDVDVPDGECVVAGGCQSPAAWRQRDGSDSLAFVIRPFVQDLSAPYVPDDDCPIEGEGRCPCAVVRNDYA